MNETTKTDQPEYVTEIEAMKHIAEALLRLDKKAQWRVMNWAVDKALGSRIAPTKSL